MKLTIDLDKAKTLKDIAKALRAKAAFFDAGGVEAEEENEAEETEETEEAEETDEEFAPPRKQAKKRAAAASFDADDEESAAEEETEPEAEEEEETPAPKKTAKKTAKGPSEIDVQAACKAYAKKHGYEKAQKLLEKKFGTKSVSKIDPKQWPTVIALMGGTGK